MNLLVVEDDPRVATFLEHILQKLPHVFAVDVVYDYMEAIDRLAGHRYDVVLLDICLGQHKEAGLDVCERLRKRNKEVAIIMVTSYLETKFLQEAFAKGANDYIHKPFSLAELQARVQHWMGMVHKIRTLDKLCYQDLVYDVVQHAFFFKDEPIELTKQQKFLLLMFLKKPEALLRTRVIEEKLWGDDFGSHNLRSNIQTLRKVLDRRANIGRWIQTRPGEGYVLQKKLIPANK